MRNLIIALAFLFAPLANGYTITAGTAASAMEIPTTFTAGDDYSELIACPSNSTRLSIYNGTASRIKWGLGNMDGVAPTDTDAKGSEIPPTTGVDLDFYVEFNGEDAVFIRSDSGSAIESGSVTMTCGGHN